MRSWRAAVSAVALLAVGCQQFASVQESPEAENIGTSRQQREATLNGQWQNRHLSDLIAALGAPRMFMDIPGGGNPPGFVAVYGVDRATGCVDAFALVYDRDPVIRVYHCR